MTDDPVGSVAQEAARLIAALRGDHLEHGTAGQDSEGPADHHDEGRQEASSSCRVCPVCRALDVVQRISPETIEQVAGFADFLAQNLNDLAAQRRSQMSSEQEDQADD